MHGRRRLSRCSIIQAFVVTLGALLYNVLPQSYPPTLCTLHQRPNSSFPCLLRPTDDGVDSVALQALGDELRAATGLRVVTVAPSANRSCAGMSLSLRRNMALIARPELGPDTYGLDGAQRWGCMVGVLLSIRRLQRVVCAHACIPALRGWFPLKVLAPIGLRCCHCCHTLA